MSSLPPYIRIQNQTTSLVFDCHSRVPTLLYYGRRLADNSTEDMLALLATRQEAKCSPAIEPDLSLVPTHADGFTGNPGVLLAGKGDEWAAGFGLQKVEQTGNTVKFKCEDSQRQLQLVIEVSLNDASPIATFQCEFTNGSANPVDLQWLCAATFPLPDHISMLKTFEGRWSNEFQTRNHELFMGSYVRENRRGKTSHDTFPGLIAYARGAMEHSGECYGFHLATSGNHKLQAEQMADGRSYVQMGELLFPGEAVLSSGQSYRSPKLYIGYSEEGFSGLSRHFHQYIRKNILRHSPSSKPRPIHYNTWEGIYFDHDAETLKSLATKVADLGVERFVLDDGWFKGRRSDKAGLGDWVVDEDVYPQSLQPLIDHVNQLGMEFGIWFEPEMVNPDSDLYRAHPDWALATDGNPQVPFRNQYVLDLSNPEVTDYLFEAIDKILTTYPNIRYIKWDMNRDINHPGNHMNKPAVHQQVQCLYKLIARVRTAHPGVEIESCCSGGGRIDLGILPYTDRFWTSDSNDALDRLKIQQGFSLFFPPEVMGAHVGPRDCHITGRHISIETRAAVALFGHMGMEMDPRELTDHEVGVLKSAFSLYKRYRPLTHSGDLYRLDDDGMNVNFGVVAKDKSEALFAYNSILETPRTTPGRFRFAGLDPNRRYTLSRVWPQQLKEYSPSVLSVVDGKVFSGQLLMQAGLQLPVLFPQTSLVFALTEAQ
ncbi:alpha-galactosidase [Alteromonas aestuariivivens]|uniref:alpha-galactosidase n=1 Tax=Alteromonas aestuariivivens TaxID=1938339 RepID=A0A3D8ME36_9ALTE|nr:alpha-galactosidase [Alteromonas aestuariivivens]RDV29013.1 alpha-galactosidase [Alteromonas aestuariivivens]